MDCGSLDRTVTYPIWYFPTCNWITSIVSNSFKPTSAWFYRGVLVEAKRSQKRSQWSLSPAVIDPSMHFNQTSKVNDEGGIRKLARFSIIETCKSHQVEKDIRSVAHVGTGNAKGSWLPRDLGISIKSGGIFRSNSLMDVGAEAFH